MILADKIINERKKNGWSQEDLAEKLGVSRQAVSKWEGAQSIPDLQKIVRLAEVFNVSTDFLLKDEMEPADRPEKTAFENQDTELDKDVRRISLEEANDFIRSENARAPRLALAVALFILSPVLLILLSGAVAEGHLHISENTAAFAGLTMLFLFVAGGVYIILSEGRRKAQFADIENQRLETSYGVSGLVRQYRNDYQDTHNRKVTLSVIMYILCALPLVLVSVLEQSGFIMIMMVGVLLGTVAVATYIIVETTVIMNSFEILLQTGDFSEAKKDEEHLSSIYWSIITAVYLATSFLTFNWGRSWIIWPVAAVAYPAVKAVVGLITGKRYSS